MPCTHMQCEHATWCPACLHKVRGAGETRTPVALFRLHNLSCCSATVHAAPSAPCMAAEQVPDHVDSLAQEALTSESPAVVESLLDAMTKVRLSKIFRIPPRKVITHPQNRYGTGVTPEDVHECIDDHITLRWLDSLFSGLVTDVPHKHRDEWLRFNKEMVDGSRGLLAPIEDDAEFAALRGNHTVNGHRCILAGSKHDGDPDITENGCLSYTKVISKCPSMELPLTVGALWLWVPFWFLERYPGLDSILQATGNFLNNTAKAENDIHVLCKVQAGLTKGFDAIRKSLDANRVKNMSALPGMFQFVRKFAGGDNLKLFLETTRFINNHMKNAKPVSGQIWDALSRDWKGKEQCLEVRYGILKLLYIEPNLITETDIKKFLGKDKERLEHAVMDHCFLSVFRDRIKDHTLNEVVVQVYGNLQMSVTAALLDKRNVWVKNIYKTYEVTELDNNKLAWYAIKLIAEVIDAAKLPIAYDEFALKQIKSEVTEPSAPVMLNVRGTGDQTASVLKDLGFDIDMHVGGNKKYDGKVFNIKSMADGFVCLQDMLSPTACPIKAPMHEFQNKEWQRCEVKNYEWVMGNASNTHQVHETTDFKCSVFRSKLTLAIAEHIGEQSALDKLVKVRVTPSKSVEVIAERIPKKELHISPASVKIKLDEFKANTDQQQVEMYKQSSLYIGSTCVGSTLCDKKHYRVYIMGVQTQAAKDKNHGTFAPFWSVSTTDVAEEANCTFTEATLNVKLNFENPSFKIPCITNTSVLKKGDVLKVYVAKKPKAGIKRKASSAIA